MHRYIMTPIEKILRKRDQIVEVEADYEGAKLVLVSYGCGLPVRPGRRRRWPAPPASRWERSG